MKGICKYSGDCGFCANNQTWSCAVNSPAFELADLKYYSNTWKCECDAKTCLPINWFKVILLFTHSLLVSPIKLGIWLFWHVKHDIIEKRIDDRKK